MQYIYAAEDPWCCCVDLVVTPPPTVLQELLLRWGVNPSRLCGASCCVGPEWNQYVQYYVGAATINVLLREVLIHISVDVCNVFRTAELANLLIPPCRSHYKSQQKYESELL